MINYSIVMRSVNLNLLEINQAKSRINQAKKDGKEPDKKNRLQNIDTIRCKQKEFYFDIGRSQLVGSDKEMVKVFKYKG